MVLSLAYAAVSMGVVWLVLRRREEKGPGPIAACAAIFLGGFATAYSMLGDPSRWTAICMTLSLYLLLSIGALIDFRTHLIPNAIPIALLSLRVVLFVIELIQGVFSAADLISSLGGLAIAFSMFAIAARISKGGIGSGDTKLVAAMGFACGLTFVLTVTVFALILCAATGGILLLTKKVDRKYGLPFAPFLWGGLVILMIMNLL